jgi:hypothetical protein
MVFNLMDAKVDKICLKQVVKEKTSFSNYFLLKSLEKTVCRQEDDTLSYKTGSATTTIDIGSANINDCTYYLKQALSLIGP